LGSLYIKNMRLLDSRDGRHEAKLREFFDAGLGGAR
jgi:hypothetical protein